MLLRCSGALLRLQCSSFVTFRNFELNMRSVFPNYGFHSTGRGCIHKESWLGFSSTSPGFPYLQEPSSPEAHGPKRQFPSESSQAENLNAALSSDWCHAKRSQAKCPKRMLPIGSSRRKLHSQSGQSKVLNPKCPLVRSMPQGYPMEPKWKHQASQMTNLERKMPWSVHEQHRKICISSVGVGISKGIVRRICIVRICIIRKIPPLLAGPKNGVYRAKNTAN